jgi:hypothetical protein
VPPDAGYNGFDGIAVENNPKGLASEGYVKAAPYTLHDIRKHTLWGNLMAGGGGVEYYFGYKMLENDLNCEDFRSRDQSWGFCRIALGFFQGQKIPFWEMQNADALIGNVENDNSKYCLAKTGETYVIFLPKGGTTDLNLSADPRTFKVKWFNPRTGEKLANGSIKSVKGGAVVSVGQPPKEADQDWVVLVR